MMSLRQRNAQRSNCIGMAFQKVSLLWHYRRFCPFFSFLFQGLMTLMPVYALLDEKKKGLFYAFRIRIIWEVR